MALIADPWWLSAALAALLLLDVALSIRPAAFVRDCLNGVRYPQDWWWTLIAIKSTAVAGLLIGLAAPGVGLAANAGVIAYFVCAAIAHVRARFFGPAFWLNCLGFLAFAVVTFALCYVA